MPARSPSDAAHRALRLLTGAPRRVSWARRGARAPTAADFFAAKGVLEAVSGALRVPTGASIRGETSRSCIPARAARSCRRRARRVARRAASRRRGGVGAGRRRRLRARPRRARAARAGAGGLRGRTSFPAVRHDLAVVVPRGRVAAARCWTCSAARRRPARRPSRSSTSSAGAQVGEDKMSLALHVSLPRARPHAHRRGGRRERRAALTEAAAGELGGELRA